MSSEPAATWFAADDLARSRWGALVEPLLERAGHALAADLMPHALLLVGPAGLGRELAAVELAARLVCPGRGGTWCDCPSCQRVRRGVHPDVERVAPEASIITIAQIRELVAAAPGRPFEGPRRVWILDGVEAGQLGREAANAFLKTLEEPGPHVHFVLLAANPQAVLPTVRSRCQQLALPGPLAVARQLGEEPAAPGLAGATLAGRPVAEGVAAAEAALRAAAGGEVLELLRLARALAGQPDAYQVAAAAALARAAGDGDAAMAHLAGRLLAAEKRARALNLGDERQLLACLLEWYRER